jgi:hypothetical protein
MRDTLGRMIPYSDLVVALRSWRERNGLPNFGVDPTSAVPAAPAPAPAPAAFARTAPPAAPPRSAPPAAIEVEDELEAHEIQSEDEYNNEGNDFAMGFGENVEADGESTIASGTAPAGGSGYGYDGGAKFPPVATEPEKITDLEADFDGEQPPRLDAITLDTVESVDQALVEDDLDDLPPKKRR